MTKIRIKGLNKEMSTTGTGASFAPGTGAQYATPKAFKKKRDEIGEPFSIPDPSIPNRKSKFIDYRKLFEKAKKALKFNPVTDFTDSQAWAGDNTGYDMDTQDAASVLELAKTSKKGEFKIGDVQIEKGTKYVVKDINPVTGAISWSVEDVPAFDSVFNDFDELRKSMTVLDQKTDDPVVDDLAEKVRNAFNRYRTHIRKNYPDAYKRFQTKENIDPKSQSKHKGKSAPFGSAYEPVKEASGGVSRSILIKLIHDIGAQRFADIIADLRDENLQDQIVAAFGLYKDEEGSEFMKPDVLTEARYSQFKRESQFRTPTQQLHIAVREIRRKIDEMSKVVSFTERMRTELKSSNEGMTYLNRTRNAISKINEKLQDLNNRIKGLTE
tara:strand:- start:532 stop:1680 length:1149 start_codon:yes stop_codon:yes gene_type:complete